MSDVATAEVAVFPTFLGFRRAVTSEVDASTKDAQSTFKRGFAGAGTAGGEAAGQGFGHTFASHISDAVASVGHAFGNVAKVVGGTALAAAGTVAGVAISKGLTRALDIQDAQKKLAGLGHSAKDVTAIMGNALDAVRGTAFGLGDAATVAASAVAAGIKPGKDLTGYLKLTADTATIAGTSLSDMGSILNKATASGTVYSDTLNQLSDRGVPVFQYLQKQYHVTADGLTDMVKKGQVDAATLDKVLQEHLAGSALKSGQTARGAFANLGAAFGRLGVQFGGGTAVDKAPALFTALSNAVDQSGAAFKPLTDLLNGALSAGFDQLTARITQIDFAKVSASVAGFTKNLHDFFDGFLNGTDDIGSNQSELASWGAQTYLVLAQVGAAIKDLFTGKLASIGPDLSAAFGGLDLSGFTGSLGSIRAVLEPLFPLFVSVAKAAGGIAGSLGQVLGASVGIVNPLLKILAGVIQSVSDHMDVIVPLIPAIVAGFVAWRIASQATLAANRLLTAAQLASLPVTTFNTAARLATARAELQVAAAQGLTIPSMIGITLATARQTIATVASKVALVGSAVATGVATAAQWAFNAALDANPIGIVVLAIAALVAGLVFFFTQTKLGQQIWAGFTTFLAAAWNAVVTAIIVAATTVWNAIVTAFNAVSAFLGQWGLVILAVLAPFLGIPILIATHWGQIVQFFVTIWSAIVAYVSGAINRLRAVISTVLAIIVTVFSLYVNAWRLVITTVWNAIVGFVTVAVNRLRGVVTVGLGAVRSVVTSVFNAVRGVVTTVWNGIVSVISGAIGRVVSVVSGLGPRILSTIRSIGGSMASAGRALIQNLINGFTSKIGAVGSAISGVVSFITDHLPHSPAKTGPLSGAGWTAVHRSGGAITDQLAAGMTDGTSTIGAAASRMAAAASVTGSGAYSTSGTAGASGPAVQIVNKTGVNLADLIDVRVRDGLGRWSSMLDTAARLGQQGQVFT